MGEQEKRKNKTNNKKTPKRNKKTERERKGEEQSPFLVVIHYISSLVPSSIETVKFFRIELITKWN